MGCYGRGMSFLMMPFSSCCCSSCGVRIFMSRGSCGGVPRCWAFLLILMMVSGVFCWGLAVMARMSMSLWTVSRFSAAPPVM